MFLDRRRLVAAVAAFAATTLVFLALQHPHTTEVIHMRMGMRQNLFRGPVQSTLSNDIYRTGEGFTNGSVPVLANGKERFAYVTFLSGAVDASDNLEEDNYFVAIRILVWQLLHKPETRTNGIDVVVMVTPSVSDSRRTRLAKDGAIVHPVDFLHVENDEWLHSSQNSWDDSVTKLRAWEMTQYSRILMLDGETVLQRPLDDIFDDKSAKIRDTNQRSNTRHPASEAPLPSRYLLGSHPSVHGINHEFPPKLSTGLKNPTTLTTAFTMLAPSRPIFDYYLGILNITNAFNPASPAQNLLNLAHSHDGPMPWRALDDKWNLRYPNNNDFANGLVSMHERWWTQSGAHENEQVRDFMRAQRWEMKGWYDAWDLRHA